MHQFVQICTLCRQEHTNFHHDSQNLEHRSLYISKSQYFPITSLPLVGVGMARRHIRASVRPQRCQPTTKICSVSWTISIHLMDYGVMELWYHNWVNDLKHCKAQDIHLWVRVILWPGESVDVKFLYWALKESNFLVLWSLARFGHNVQGSASPRGPGSVKMWGKSCVRLPAAGRKTQIFIFIFTKPGSRKLAYPCKYLIWMANFSSNASSTSRWFDLLVVWTSIEIIPNIPRNSCLTSACAQVFRN